MQLKESSCPSEAPAANHLTATVAPIRRHWIGPLGLLLLLALLLPAAALAQPEGGAVIVERKQSYHLGKLWVWTTDEGHVAVHGEMSPLFEMEMAVLNVTPARGYKCRSAPGSIDFPKLFYFCILHDLKATRPGQHLGES